MQNLLLYLKLANEKIGIAAGLLLLVTVLVTLFDIIARPLGMSIGGTDEISGYAMAITTSWGISYALTGMAHVRIDLLRTHCGPKGRALFDAVATLSLAAVAIIAAYQAWPVLAKSIKNGSTANTTLETPLWIPQSLWLMGWMWFALSAILVSTGILHLIFKGRFEKVSEIAGIRSEG